MDNAPVFTSSEEFERRGTALYESGDIYAALRTFEEGLDMFPHTPELHTGRGFMYLCLGEFVQALSAFSAGLALNPHDPELNKGTGIALCHLNRADEAMPHLEIAIPYFRGDEQNLFDIAVALFQACKYDQALALLDEVVSVAPQNAEANYYRALTLHHVGGRTDEVRDAYEKALSLSPDRTDIAESFVNALYECGLWGEALAVFSRLDLDDVWDDLLVERMIEVCGKFRGSRRKRSAMKSRLAELRSRSDVDRLIEDLEQDWKAAADEA